MYDFFSNLLFNFRSKQEQKMKEEEQEAEYRKLVRRRVQLQYL